MTKACYTYQDTSYRDNLPTQNINSMAYALKNQVTVKIK